MVLIQLMIYSFFQCLLVIMHLSMWVASSLSTYVIPVLFNKNSSANISRSPFIKIIIYSMRFVIINTFIKKIFASTVYNKRVLLFPSYGFLPHPVKFSKMLLCSPDFKIRIHVYYFGFYNPGNAYV